MAVRSAGNVLGSPHSKLTKGIPVFKKSRERLGHADYFGERALLGNEVRSASITALEEGGLQAESPLMLARMCQDTELWKMGKETFQEMMPGPT